MRIVGAVVRQHLAGLVAAVRWLAVCLPLLAASAHDVGADERASLIARAQVWNPGDIGARDLLNGPASTDGFAPGQTVHCAFTRLDPDGNSPKFRCLLPPADEVKVKFGGTNGEVYGEVLATRLLWALGFGADRVYLVRVLCRGCSPTIGEPFGTRS